MAAVEREMEQGRETSRGLEAVARGLQGAPKVAEHQAEQQRMMMMTLEQQIKVNNAMAKGETMGDCPKMTISQSLESWVEEVKMWNCQFPEPELSTLKYLNFVNSVRESENVEMKKFIEISVMDN